MFFMLLPPVLAGLIGLWPSGADEASYPAAIRTMFQVGALLGFLGIAIWAFRRNKGVTRWACIGAAFLTVRIVYPFLPFSAVMVTGWIDGIVDGTPASGAVHYSMGLFTGAFAVIAALIGVITVLRIKRWFVMAILLAALGLFNFWDADDHSVSRIFMPHPAAKRGRPPTEGGQDYMEVAKDKKKAKRTRVLALATAVFDAMLPSDGWIGAVSSDYKARFKANPDMSVSERLTALEASLIRARSSLSTSPRNPPKS